MQKTLRANFDGTRERWIDPAWPGARRGLRDGDVVRAVDGEPVASEGDIRSGVRAPGERLQAQRRTRRRGVRVRRADPDGVHYVVPERPWSE
jgi:S1-C subfamily serine protease